MKKYRLGYVLGMVAVVLNQGIWILFPQVMRFAVNALRTGVTREKLLTYSLLLVGIALVKGVFQFLTRWILIGISREVEFDLRNDLFGKLEALSYSFYQRTRTGDIMARATNDLNAVRMLLGPALMYPANTLVFSAGALALMYRMNPRLTFYAFLPLPVVSLMVHYMGKQIHQRFERIQAMFSDISAKTQENFAGARVVRAFAQEEAEIASFESDNREYIARSMRLVRMQGMLWPTLETMLGLAIALVIWLGSREVLLHRMDLGEFIAYIAYMGQLMWPVIALGWVISLFQRGTASLKRINEILTEKPEIADEATAGQQSVLVSGKGTNGDGQPGSEIRGEIEFRGLNFAYNGAPVLKNVNLRIPAGSSLAVVGPTGSGKSTLVSLIPRIYDATRGSVVLDGKPLRDYPLADLRLNIGFVPQETFLFSDTVRGNIAFGAEHASMDAVEGAAEAANIAADIGAFPEKYETMVGERGITLSGGQKQRTAIARALIRNPRILILDDALSSVDTYTEEKILNHLRDVMRGRTTIFISHRVSTVRNADRIAVLHGGEIVEFGTHDELLARNGYYTDLYTKQLLEEELESV